MLAKSRAIVLHTVRYGEKSLIATLYTHNFGRQPAILNAARGAGSKNRGALFQPLSLIETETYVKKNRELQRIKEVKLSAPYQTIPFDVKKSAQCLFLADILRKILVEESGNPELFTFMENSLLYFDMMEQGSSGFHIWFLIQLSGYLGIFPQSGSGENHWFDMEKGTFVAREPLHPNFMKRETTSQLLQVMDLKVNELDSLQISPLQRNILLNKFLEYLHLHFGNLNHVKSLPVVKELFSD